MKPFECEIISRPVQATVCRRTVTPVDSLPQVLGETYGMIMAHLGQHGQQPVGAPYVAYYNMDMQALDLEAGFPVAAPLPGAGYVEAGEIPAGEFATTLHVGPYQEIGKAYTALNEFIAGQGLESTGVAYEVYLNDPSITPQEHLQTQILFPLK